MALPRCHALIRLHISDNRISAIGAQYMALALAANPPLKELIFTGSNVFIKDAGAEAFCTALERNKVLICVHIGLSISNEMQTALNRMFARNILIRPLHPLFTSLLAAGRRNTLAEADPTPVQRLLAADGDHAIKRRVVGFLIG